MKHQLLICNRAGQRALNLSSSDRLALGLTKLFVSPRRIAKLDALIKRATAFVQGDKTVVGDRDPVGVAGQISLDIQPDVDSGVLQRCRHEGRVGWEPVEQSPR